MYSVADGKTAKGLKQRCDRNNPEVELDDSGRNVGDKETGKD